VTSRPDADFKRVECRFVGAGSITKVRNELKTLRPGNGGGYWPAKPKGKRSFRITWFLTVLAALELDRIALEEI
jgi:hypothetical protein